MKFKITNKKLLENILTEDEQADRVKNSLSDPTAVPEKDAFDSFTADGEYLYVQDKKKQDLPVNIIIPEELSVNINIPSIPVDINNIMSSTKVNTARKTLNLGDTMEDPIETYNQAKDLCAITFENFFKEGSIKFTNPKTNANEGVLFNESNSLNEGTPAVVIGATHGATAGSIAASGLSYVAGFAATSIASVLPMLTALGLGAYGIGYYGQLIAGDTKGHGVTNDKVAAHIKNVQKNIQAAAIAPINYENIVSAFDKYTPQVANAIKNLGMAISPQVGKKLSELPKFIMGVQTAATKNLQEYLEKNNKAIEEQKRVAEEKAKLAAEKKNLKSEKDNLFTDKLMAAASNATSISDISLVDRIRKFYIDCKKDNVKDELSTAADKDFAAIVQVYNKVSKFKPENIEYNGNILNEAENEETPQKPPIDLAAIYTNAKAEISRMISEAFDELDKNNIAGIADAKKIMQDMITGADTEIKHKIEQITKSPQGESYGKETGLGSAARTFLMGHPIEAETLNGIWSRHLADLNTRMNKRLHQMTDFENETRTLGWTKNILCTEVCSEILARMIAYRYGYAVLANSGIYKFDPAKIKRYKEEYQTDKDDYLNSARTKLCWLLLKTSAEYTNGGSIVEKSNDGGWKLTDAKLVYGTLFLIRVGALANNAQLMQNISKFGTALANIKQIAPDENEAFNKFIEIVFNMLDPYFQKVLLGFDDADENTTKEAFNNLYKRFELPDNFKTVKPLIEKTYNTIINDYKKQVDEALQGDQEELMSQAIVLSFNTFWKNPAKVYQAYAKNQQKIDAMITEFDTFIKTYHSINDDVELPDEDKNKLDMLRSDMKKFFADIEITEPEKKLYSTEIKNMFNKNENDAQQDYYSYILSWFGTLKNVINENGEQIIKKTHSPEGMTSVCNVITNILKFILSGLLILCVDIDEKEETNKTDDIKELLLKTKEASEGLVDYYIVIEKATDNAKQPLVNLFNEIFKDINTKYKENSKDSDYMFTVNEETFKNIVNIIENNDLTTSLDPLNELAISVVEGKHIENPKTKFGDIDDNKVKESIVSNFCKTILSIVNNPDYATLKDYIIILPEIAEETPNGAENPTA